MQRFKEENNKLIPPPVNLYVSTRGWIMNFNLNPELMDQYGYLERTNEWIENWYKEHSEPKPPVTIDQLTELTYKYKAEVAYGGLTFVKDSISYKFDTDQGSISMCNAQVLSMATVSDDYEFGWKVYVNNYPTLLSMTKAEFIKVYGFGIIMVNSAFTLEGSLNSRYESMSDEEIEQLDINEEENYIRLEFNKIQRVYEIK